MLRNMTKQVHPITAFKRAHELTNLAFADLVGVSWRQIRRIEAGELEVTARVAKKVERGTKGKLSAAELLGLAPKTHEAA